jgi:GntR family transcriptional regulator/MocR family aminotransferase
MSQSAFFSVYQFGSADMLHIKLDKTPHHPPYYLQIVEQVRNAILSGDLTAGARLPSSRQLAVELGIARRTVVLAYEELCDQGYCTSRVGQGTLVAQMPSLQRENEMVTTRGFPQWLEEEDYPIEEDYVSKPETSCPGKICFTPSLAQVDRLPVKTMQRILQRVMRNASEFGQYKKDNGDVVLIESICKHVLPSRGISAEPEQVLITNGSQHSSSLLSILFATYGGSISYGVPGYLAIPKNFLIRGMIGIPCPVDEEGVHLTKEALRARLHYVMPEHHFPQGVTLAPCRRAALLQLAEERDALIIEDDYDSEFYYDRHPLPALKAEDLGGRVVYMGTFSKVLFNGLRLGYIVAHPEIIRRLVNIRWQLDGGTSLVLQRWVAQMLESGVLERHIRRMRLQYRKKRDLIAYHLNQLFPEWCWKLPNGGMQFWIELPPHRLAETVICRAAQRGVGLWSGAEYYEQMSEEALRHLILGFGAVTQAEIDRAFARLGNCSQQKPGLVEKQVSDKYW